MLTIKQLKVPVDDNDILKYLSKKLHVELEKIKKYEIAKQSIDARDKNNIYYVYEIDFEIENEKKYLSNIIDYTKDKNYYFKYQNKNYNKKIYIVGSGPAGLFCAYVLSENGYKPVVIERGDKIENRVKKVDDFWNNNILDENSNVQFGEGGAGTFSDGKLNTLIKDENNRMRKVFEVFVECGAPREILYNYKPHIGTDILRNVIIKMREKIINNGGQILYNSCLTDLIIKNNTVDSIVINNQDIINCENIVLAIGHSSRDTFRLLESKNVNMEAKPFAIGIRIQHPQEMIDRSQYGTKYNDYLNKASYKLTYNFNKRGIYTFCMCPGGYVVNASSIKNHLAINGMSYNDRNSSNANSAIIVTVSPDDFGNKPLDGLKYQEYLERKAYQLGNGKILTQLLIDYYNNQQSKEITSFKPCFKGEYILSNINELFSKQINDSIKEALKYFGKKIDGFDRNDAIISAIESRSSSPVRILRNTEFESNIKGLYPCGEGAGYAGGITSSAIDGIKVAEAIAKKYNKKSS